MVLYEWEILSISLLIWLFMAFLYQEGLAGTSAKSYLVVLPYTDRAINGPRKPVVIRGFKKIAAAKQGP